MKILVGVTGGIAAYKAAELVRNLQDRGVEVEVAMTSSAQQFVQPLTFAALTGKRVYTSLWTPETGQGSGDPDGDFDIEHITVGQEIDALVIAPATANIIAKLAQGLADDFLTTLYLATTKPVFIAPSMNVNMWNHPATQANIRTLRQRGAHIIEPDAGYLACGMTGSGRLAAVNTIATEVLTTLQRPQDLSAETILITAGGTREPIDPVRYIGNRSSGKMGHALAEAAVARGASVVLITSSDLPAPPACKLIRVSTAEQMEQAALAELPQATVVIKAAAVADFRPRSIAPAKLRREGTLTLELEPTEDIVAKVVAQKSPDTLVIAFAAESENLEVNARAKLQRKSTDAIVANDISIPGFGFDSDSNTGLFITRDRTVRFAPASKREMADRILDELITLRAAHLK